MSAAARRRIRRSRLLLYLFLILLATLVVLELFCRAFWTVKGLNFWNGPRHIQSVYYPNVEDYRPMLRPRGRARDTVEILILGGSAVNPMLGPIPTLLLERLTVDLKARVNITDLALPAHTSLDSYYRYRDLADSSFDLVLVYNSINELRANNCPPWMFHDNYSHYLWYREVNAVEHGAETRLLALPITLHLALIRAAQRLGLLRLIPPDAPVNPEWVKFGGEIKTAGPLRNNLRRIVDLAAERGEKVVLMTYAYHLAPGYTRAKFDLRRLDYVSHWFPVETWGVPDDIRKGLALHNEKIRELARQLGDQVLYVDQAALMPQEGLYYNDICHFSTAGCERFVDHLIPVIEPYLKQLPVVRAAAGASALPSPANDDAATSASRPD